MKWAGTVGELGEGSPSASPEAKVNARGDAPARYKITIVDRDGVGDPWLDGIVSEARLAEVIARNLNAGWAVEVIKV